MSIIPCSKSADLARLIDDYVAALRAQAHTLGGHGLDEAAFRNSGLFRAAIESIRGSFSATMSEKHAFAERMLDQMRERGFIALWETAGASNRHDYVAELPNGRVAAIELKGCLDGNNTNIFVRPPRAQEFVIWSVCTNPGSDPRHNVWSGIHTRLSAEIIAQGHPVDGVIVWDMVCGTVGRPCPKVVGSPERLIALGDYRVPPPCIYVFPGTVPSARNNPHPVAQRLEDVQILAAFHRCFGGRDEEVNYVDFDVHHEGAETVRTTTVRRAGEVVRQSRPTAIRRG